MKRLITILGLTVVCFGPIALGTSPNLANEGTANAHIAQSENCNAEIGLSGYSFPEKAIVVSEDGKIDLGFTNEFEHGNPVIVELALANSGERIYRSDLVKHGESLPAFLTSYDFYPGEYQCSVTIINVDKGSGIIENYGAFGVILTVP